jgi:hypothetical protein
MLWSDVTFYMQTTISKIPITFPFGFAVALTSMLSHMFRWPTTLNASAIFTVNKGTASSVHRHAFSADLISHLRECGFARLRNHGVAPRTVQKLFQFVCMHSILFNYALAYSFYIV